MGGRRRTRREAGARLLAAVGFDEDDQRPEPGSSCKSPDRPPPRRNRAARLWFLASLAAPILSLQCYPFRNRNPSSSPVVAGIDALPDEALQHVLGFLPAREAVRTCVLARRWRHLWRSVPALRVTSAEFGTEHEFLALNKFVKNLLRLRDPKAPLEFCEFLVTLLGDSYGYGEPPDIRSWVAQALARHARVLRVHHNDMDPDFLIDLVDMHFTSQRLTTVELKSVTVTGDFSGCLVLKNLRMIRCNVTSDRVSCQSVRQLAIIQCWFLSGKRTRISAPSVVRLELSDGYYRAPLLENMPSLVNAFIRLSSPDDCCGKEYGNSCSNLWCANCTDNSDAVMDCVILKGLSNAESLELIAVPTTFIFKRDLVWHPTFSKLKTLLLNEWCVSHDFCPLICFLQHTPVLEKLTLQLSQAPDNWGKPRSRYVPSKEPFASKKLRVIEIKCEMFDERVHQVSRMLSIYNYLEKVTIECSERYSECYSFQKNDDPAW